MDALCLNPNDPQVAQYIARYGLRETYKISLQHQNWLPDFAQYQLKREADLLPREQAMSFLSNMVDTSQFNTRDLSELTNAGLIPQGTEAAFYRDSFYFASEISRGAVSEEAFHSVFQRVIPVGEQENLLDTGRLFLAQHAKELGFKSVNSYYEQVVNSLPETYKSLSKQERLNRLYEEALAKEFVRYQTYSKQAAWERKWKESLTPVLGSKASSRVAQVISQLFRKLQQLLGFYDSNRVLADLFFSKLNTGAYQTAKVTEAGDTATTPTTRIIRLLNGETVSVREAQQLLRNMGALVLQLQEHPSFSYLSENELVEKAMDLFSTQYTTTPGGTLISGVLKPTDFDMELFEEVPNPEYYNIKNDLVGYLKELRSVSALLEEEFEDELGSGAGTNEFAGYDKEANEVGGFAGQSSWVKQYIARTGVPRTDTQGNPLTHKIDVDGTLLELPILDVVDPQKVYTGMVRSLSNTDSVPLRLEKLLAYTDFDANVATSAFSKQLLLDLSPVTYVPTEFLKSITQRYDIPSTVNSPAALDQLLPATVTGKQRSEILGKSFTSVQEKNPVVLRENLRKAIQENRLDTYLTPGGKNVLIRVLKGFDLWKRVMLNQRVDASNGLSVLSDANTNRASRNLYAQWQDVYEKRGAEQGNLTLDARLDLDAYGIPVSTLAQLDPADQSTHLEQVFAQEVVKQQAFFSQIGVTLPDVYLQYRLQDQLKRVYPEVYSEGTKAARLYNLYSVDPKYLFTASDIASVEAYAKQTEHSPYVSDGSRKLSGGMVTRLRDLAEGASLFDENAVDSSYQNSEQKTVYSYQQKTYSLELFNWFQETGLAKLRNLYTTGNRQKLREENGEAVYLKHDSWALTQNRLLGTILSDEFSSFRSQLTGFTVDGTTQTELIGTSDYAQSKPGAVANTGVTYGGMSPREFDQFNLNALVSKYTVTAGNTTLSPVFLGNRETSKTGEYMVLPLLNNVVSGGKITDTGKRLILDEIRKEYERIQTAYGEINPDETGKPQYSPVLEKATNYHTGKKLKSYQVKTPTRLGVTVHAPTAGKDFRSLQFTDGLQGILADNWTALPGDTSTESNNLILAALAGYEFEQIAKKLDSALERGIDTFLSEHYKRFEQEGLWKGNTRTSLLNPKLSKEKIDNKLVSDLLNNISFAQIAYGDAALLYKNDGVDVFKRLKGLNAAIINFKIPFASPEQGIDTASTFMRVITIKEPGGASDVSGENIDIADAQGYQSVQARRKHLYGAGRLTPLHVRVLDAIQEGKPIIGDLLKDLRASGIMYNSEKTVGADGQQYKKLSESMLSKELTADKKPIPKQLFDQYASIDKYGRTQLKIGSPEVSSYLNDRTGERECYIWSASQGTRNLNDLRLKMDGFHLVDGTWVFRGLEHRVDLVTPISASKTLNVNVHETVDENGNPNWGTVSDRSIHQVDLNFYGLQTENPSGKQKIVDPTQMLEIIANEQGDILVYHDGKLQSKTQLEPLWQEYLKNRDSTSYSIARKVFDTPDGDLDLSRFRESAFAAVISSGKDKQTVGFFDPQNNLNLNLPLTRDQFISSFFNHFSKGVLSHKRAGDSLAHVSSFGHQVVKKIYRVKLADGTTKLTWDVVRKGTPEYYEATRTQLPSLKQYQYKHTFKSKAGSKAKERLEESEWFTQAGSILGESSSVYVLDSLRHLKPRLEETSKGSGIYKQTGYFSEALIPVHDDKIKELTPELKYSFGVRIPSQDKHSAMNVEWVDTMPAFMGSSIVLPKEVVELSGSDFDIDKLYLTRTEGYWEKDARGNQQFIQYGKEVTDDQRWNSFVHYTLDHYKPIKRDLKKLLHEPEFEQLDQVVNLLQADQRNATVDEDNLPDWTPELLQQYFSGDLEGLSAKLETLYNKALSSVLKNYELPATAGEYLALPIEKQEALHVGVIQNKMLDLQQGFLANDITIDDADPSGGQYNQPANLDKYNELEGEKGDNGKNLFGDVSTRMSTHAQITHSRVHEKNQVGKALIGIGVNGNLFMINAVRLGFTVQENYLPKLDDGYVHDGTYRARTHDSKSDDVRVFDVISTIITADTDEAKEAKNAFFKLGTDTQGAVIHMVGLGYSLLDALMFVNQPVVQEYVALSEKVKRVKRGVGVVATDERSLGSLGKEAIAKRVLGEFPELEEDVPYTSQDLRDSLAGKPLNTDQEVQLLRDFMNLVEVNEFAGNFIRFIKLKKGFGRDLPSFDQLTEALTTLQNPIIEHPIDIMQKLEDQPQLGAQYLHLMEHVIGNNLSLQADVFVRRHPWFVSIADNLKSVLGLRQAADVERFNKAIETFIITKLYQQDQKNTLDSRSVYQGNEELEITQKLKNFQAKYAYTKQDESGKVIEKGAFADNPIFSLLFPTSTRDGVSGLKLGAAVKLTPEQQENLLDAFRDLYTNSRQPVEANSSGVEEPVGYTMARELLNYHIVKDGWQYTMGNITRLFPPEVFSRISTQLDQFQKQTGDPQGIIHDWSAELLTALGRDVSFQENIRGIRKPSPKSEAAALVRSKGVFTYQTVDEKPTTATLTANLVLDLSKLTEDELVAVAEQTRIRLTKEKNYPVFSRFVTVRDIVDYYDEDFGDNVSSSEEKVYELVSVIDPKGNVVTLDKLLTRVAIAGVKARYVEVIPSGTKAVSPATALEQQYTGDNKEKIQKLRETLTPGTATANYYGVSKPNAPVVQEAPVPKRSLMGMISPDNDTDMDQDNDDLLLNQPCAKP